MITAAAMSFSSVSVVGKRAPANECTALGDRPARLVIASETPHSQVPESP